MDPLNCPVGPALEFLQEDLAAGMAPATLKVYLAAISATHTSLNVSSVRRHPILSQFLHGARWMWPICWSQVSSWYLELVLGALTEARLRPWHKSQTLLQRVGDLLALSVASSS